MLTVAAGLPLNSGLTGSASGRAMLKGKIKAGCSLMPIAMSCQPPVKVFGSTIAEALAHGTPVITTRRTLWKDLESLGVVGLWIIQKLK